MEMFRHDELPESENDKQVVYKINGDFVGDIKGNNVTVILMGDGDFVGDIDSKDGEVVLIKGNINGDVKANKIICPINHNEKNCFECIVGTTKHNPAKDVKSPKLPVRPKSLGFYKSNRLKPKISIVKW